MNKCIMLLSGLFLSGSAIAQLAPFEIKGTLKGAHKGYVYLSYQTHARGSKQDSALVKNGQFSFKGELAHPVSATVMLQHYEYYTGGEDIGSVYIEPGKMQLQLVKGDLRHAKLSGSASQLENEKLNALNAEARKKMEPFSKQYDAGNTAYIAAMKAKKEEATLNKMKDELQVIKEKMEPYQEQMQKNTIDFIKNNPQSWVALHLMRFYASNMKVEEGEAWFAKTTTEMQQSAFGKELKKELESLRMGSPGSTAFVFSKKDINGQDLSLSDYKGKYVLVDFWASWCVPCRKGNPHLKSLYSKYKEKGFEIIGISDDDRNESAWKKAVDQDGIGIWKHVLRGLDMDKAMKGEDNPNDLSDKYGIHSLPTKILINPEGVIVGRYGGGGENDEAMDKKLKEIFGN